MKRIIYSVIVGILTGGFLQGAGIIENHPPANAVLALRMPGWSPAPRLSINGAPIGSESIRDGYAYLPHAWEKGDVIELDLPMPVERIYAHPAVRAAAGRVALRRGPLVYCMEEADCGSSLEDVALSDDAEIRVGKTISGRILKTVGTRSSPETGTGGLYRTTPSNRVPAPLVWIPYCEWGHRGGAEMRVWTRRSLQDRLND